MTLSEFITTARRVSVPLIAVSTPDPGATFQAIRATLPAEAPCFEYRPSMGAIPANQAAQVIAQGIAGDLEAWYDRTGNPAEFLRIAQEFPERTLIAMHMGHAIIGADPRTTQAVWDCRDAFKRNYRTLVLLGPSFSLPPELSNDVVCFDEPLPGALELQEIITRSYRDAKLEPPTAEVLAEAVPALTGLAAFTSDQITAMSLTKSGLDVPALWARKRQMISATPGLSVYNGPETFADIGGCNQIKRFLSAILKGKRKPGGIVFMDEIEKALAGIGGLDGTSQDQHGALLQFMQDKKAAGCIFIGPPGAAKSAIAKAAGNEGGMPTIQFDLGATKNSLVGSSEARIRNALKVIDSVTGGSAFFLVTCNSIGALSPELRRRLAWTFFFDLPTAEEQRLIWPIYTTEPESAWPPCTGWTGAEIRNCCDIADRLGCSLTEAAAYVVPVSQAAAQMIQKLRQDAAGKFLSAAQPGLYHPAEQPAPSLPSRGIALPIDMRGGNA